MKGFNLDRLIGQGRMKHLYELLLKRHHREPAPAARARADLEHVLGEALDHLAHHYSGSKRDALEALRRLQAEAFDFYGDLLDARGTPDLARLEKILRDMDAEIAKLARTADEVAAAAPKLDVPLPAKRPAERPIPEGGISVEQRRAQGGKPDPEILARAELYYYKDGQYRRRPAPPPDFSSDAPAARPPGPPPERPIPPGGLTVEDGKKAGYKPRKFVEDDPDLYYFDPTTKQFSRRAPPPPDFGDGNQRPIPCFLPGTLVRTDLGWTAIEHVAPGSVVLSADEALRRLEPQPVVAVHRGRTARVVHLALGCEELATTRGHRFLVDRAGWLEARALARGDRLRTAAAGPVEIVRVWTEEVDGLATHNLEIAQHHTYFVGSSSVLVHNEGEERVWRIYVGRTPDGSLYVGRAKTDLIDREAKHRLDAKKQPEKYGFKASIKLDPVPGMDGLTLDEAIWHERRIFDHYKKNHGAQVKNIEDPPTGDEKIAELRDKYC